MKVSPMVDVEATPITLKHCENAREDVLVDDHDLGSEEDVTKLSLSSHCYPQNFKTK